MKQSKLNRFNVALAKKIVQKTMTQGMIRKSEILYLWEETLSELKKGQI